MWASDIFIFLHIFLSLYLIFFFFFLNLVCNRRLKLKMDNGF